MDVAEVVVSRKVEVDTREVVHLAKVINGAEEEALLLVDREMIL